MAPKKRAPRRFVATEAERLGALDRLLGHDDPKIWRDAEAALEAEKRARRAVWNPVAVQQQVLWPVKHAARYIARRAKGDAAKIAAARGDAAKIAAAKEASDEHANAWADRTLVEISHILADPRAQGIGKAAGLTHEIVLTAIVAWAEPPGRRPRDRQKTKQRLWSGTRTDNTRRKERAALALLRAIGLASNVTLDAITKLIDRHVGRAADPVIDALDD